MLTNCLENNMVYCISLSHPVVLIQVFFISYDTIMQVPLFLFKSKTNSLLNALFFAVVVKRMLLQILILTNKNS